MTTAVDVAEKGHQLAAWVNFNGTFADTSGQSGTYACSGSTITITDTAHGLSVGDSIHAAFTRSAGDTTTITDDFFVVLTVPSADTFTIQTVVATTDQSGSVVYDSDAATATAGSGPIRGSYNIASITDNGGTGGNYTVNFATAMPDANYCVVGTSGKATSTYQSTTSTVTTIAISSSSIQILNREWGTNTVIDAEYMFVAIFR
jgi:hypothetical protein